MKRPSPNFFRSIKQLFSPVRVQSSSVRLGVEQLSDRIVPAGVVVQTAFFLGAQQDTFDKVEMSFDQDINTTTFDATDITITGPNGAIPVTGVTPIGGGKDAFTITFAVQDKQGDYKILIGPDVRNAADEKMDQNRNGTLGEAGIVPAGDVFEGTGILAAGGNAAGPVVDFGSGFGGATGTFDKLTIAFRPTINGLDAATFTADDVTITGPNGAVAVTGVTEVTGAAQPTFTVSFAPQTTAGDYTAVVGPDIRDLVGAGMDQNENGTPLEPGPALGGDQYTVTQSLTAGGGGGPVFAIGAADGTVSVREVDSGNAILLDFRPLDTTGSKYTGLVSVALGDFNGDLVSDLLVASANPAGVKGLDTTKAGKVFVYDGATLATGKPTLIRDFTPFATSDGPAGKTGAYINGLNIAVGDVNGDKQSDLIAGTRGGSATVGKIESGRMVVIDGASPAGASNLIGAILNPFSTGYQKGVIVAAGDTDDDGKSEVAVTRGGPVASTNDAVQTIKVKVFKYDGTTLNELNLTGTGTPLAPFGDIGAPGNRIVRDGRVTFVDSDGDGKDELVFTALDRSTDPSNVKVRVGVYAIDGTTGLGTLVSTGAGGTPTSYLAGTQVVDHAITFIVRQGVAVNDLAILVEAKTAADSGFLYLDPLTGANKGGLILNPLTGGITLDGA